MPYCSICKTWYEHSWQHSVETCASENMSKGAPGYSQTYSSSEEFETGSEVGEALGALSGEFVRRFPKISLLMGLFSSLGFLYYALGNFELNPVILALCTIAIGVIGWYSGLALLFAAVVIGGTGFLIIYLLSLL